MTEAALALADRWQRDFPLVEHPFAQVGQSAGLDEAGTIATFADLCRREVISRIGAVVAPNTIGASTLAAMRVAPDRIDEVAAIVGAEPMVNHNYERDHDINLWFVVTGPDATSVADTLSRIEQRTSLPTIKLPLIQAYYLDLGFSLRKKQQRPRLAKRPIDYRPDPRDRKLLAAIEDGLPLVPRPYREVGRQIELRESEVIERLRQLTAAGIVSRFGCILRHRTLGYSANAMAVWDIPDNIADMVAAHFVNNTHVTLCYRRPRELPHWPYNLFCMIHARSRPEALAVVDDLNAMAETSLYAQTVLFSTRCFKQRGAVFSDRLRGR
jgi:DNA-binding Lrp family transcriptional regulator